MVDPSSPLKAHMRSIDVKSKVGLMFNEPQIGAAKGYACLSFPTPISPTKPNEESQQAGIAVRSTLRVETLLGQGPPQHPNALSPCAITKEIGPCPSDQPAGPRWKKKAQAKGLVLPLILVHQTPQKRKAPEPTTFPSHPRNMKCKKTLEETLSPSTEEVEPITMKILV